MPSKEAYPPTEGVRNHLSLKMPQSSKITDDRGTVFSMPKLYRRPLSLVTRIWTAKQELSWITWSAKLRVIMNLFKRRGMMAGSYWRFGQLEVTIKSEPDHAWNLSRVVRSNLIGCNIKVRGVNRKMRQGPRSYADFWRMQEAKYNRLLACAVLYLSQGPC
ncbi:hypothetical protein BJX99DRAFT_119790 [Aspergillus californicus]